MTILELPHTDAACGVVDVKNTPLTNEEFEGFMRISDNEIDIGTVYFFLPEFSDSSL